MKLVKGTPILTHAIYADDITLFGEASGNKMRGLNQILEKFEKFSGLQINLVNRLFGLVEPVLR
jgi:hypothetical protein